MFFLYQHNIPKTNFDFFTKIFKKNEIFFFPQTLVLILCFTLKKKDLKKNVAKIIFLLEIFCKKPVFFYIKKKKEKGIAKLLNINLICKITFTKMEFFFFFENLKHLLGIRVKNIFFFKKILSIFYKKNYGFFLNFKNLKFLFKNLNLNFFKRLWLTYVQFIFLKK